MVMDYSLLEVEVKALKEQFSLVFLSVVEGILTTEKKATPFLSLKNLVVMTSTISWFFSACRNGITVG